MDTNQQIIRASIEVFSKKGYNNSSTLEIAKVAGVAEVTLFRKFKTKKNLFEEVIKEALNHAFIENEAINQDEAIDVFLYNLLYNRLLIISKQRDIIRMMIQESLQGNIPKELNYVDIISNKIIEKINKYCELSKSVVDVDILSSVIVGILLQNALIKQQKSFHELTKHDQDSYVKLLLNMISI